MCHKTLELYGNYRTSEFVDPVLFVHADHKFSVYFKPKLQKNLLYLQISHLKVILHSYMYRKIDEEKFLPLLMYVLTHGNVTVYEWKHDEPPPDQNQNGTGIKLENGNGDFEIDWGDLTDPPAPDDQPGSAAAAGIDFGEPGIDFGESEIDFGTTDVDISAITIEDSGEVGERSNETVGESHTVVTNTTAQPSGMYMYVL